MLQPVKPSRRSTQRVASSKTNRDALIPAPVLGLDTSLPFSDQNPRTAVSLSNFICRRTGNELRGGAKRWTTNLGGVGTESPVGTLASYLPPQGTGSSETAKLFAFCEDEKIYDVTSSTNEATVPAAVATLSTQTEPGVVSHVNFAVGGTNYLLVAIAGVGYYTYDHAGGWVNRTSSVTGVSLTNVAYVTIWKKRVWFILQNDTSAWYLPVGVITGAAAEFDFGPVLPHGGELRTLSSWTIDSGEGIDDKLVLVGAGGDVVIYGGTDPTSADTFGLIGVWYVGPPAAGRRFVTQYGGDLGIICENGIEFMSRMISAKGLLTPDGEMSGGTRRYNEVIAADVRSTRGSKGWHAIHDSTEDSVIILTPHFLSGDTKQYCFSTVPPGWSTFNGIQAKCGEFFNGNLYVGTPNGTIQKMFAADSDDELTNGTVGADVLGELQTAFMAPNDDRMSLKRPQLVMPMFQAPEAPSVKVRVNTEWSSEGAGGSPAFSADSSSVWDTGLWDSAIWFGALNSYLTWIGCEGLGCYFSLRMAVVGKPRTLFTSWKVIYNDGGVM